MEASQSIPEIDAADLQARSREFETATPHEVLRWGLERYKGGITLACSLGAEDVVLAEMVGRIDRATPIFYLDTDYLFPETFEVRDRLKAKYGLNFVAVKPAITVEEQAAQHGVDLFGRQPDLCCKIRKVDPLRRHLGGYRAWITGIRRDQAPTRANAGLVEWDKMFNLVKFNPLARWTWEDVWAYIKANDVPYNVLHDRNYPSIGCQPCTRQVQPGEDPRAGRWANFAKKECGLHVDTGKGATQ